MSDLNLTFGETRILDVLVTDSTGVAGTVDITGSSFWFTVKADWLDADADALIAKTVGAGITITDGPNGAAEIEILAADWLAFVNEPVQFVWGITEQDTNSDIWRLDRGTMLVAPAAQEVIP